VSGGTAVLWFIQEALQSQDIEGASNITSIRKALLNNEVAEGSKHFYQGYKWCDDIDMWSYAGLSKTENSTIYWYDATDYNAWIDELESGKISIDWSNGYVTVYPGTSKAKVIKPCDDGTGDSAGLSLTAGNFVLGEGKTALLLAGGAAAFVVAAKLYDDPTILDSAKQKVQNFFGGITDTVKSWLPHAAPAEEPATGSDAAQPAQIDTPAA
jgi:hypothetical protein